MTPEEMEARIVRYADLKPCRSAFIDAHSPGSDQKDNFAIIGGGVSENPEQHVHIRETHGFNIGAAGQPPGCRNSLHSHRTAEVFFVLSGRWRFFWGRRGDAGDVQLEEGDVFDIPTGIFRGFENVGQDYGMIMAILGGDDAGGGVIWAPEVIEEAKAHGLVLGDDDVIYDSNGGQALPDGVRPMPLPTAAELEAFPELPASEVVPDRVVRYGAMLPLAAGAPVRVIGAGGLIENQPGFELEFLSRDSIPDTPYATHRDEVLMVMRGHWAIDWRDSSKTLGPGDTCALPPGLERALHARPGGEASLFRVRNTDEPARAELRPRK